MRAMKLPLAGVAYKANWLRITTPEAFEAAADKVAVFEIVDVPSA